ncbi:d-isomer specific 2-hydroxyacid dehydrogenase, NAD binding domain-containing protein [Sarocladium implicatum]|nr:d-isomer specific 2-hydroxyacid dehydrogenase, NAD binding domain-containing protein [Sarocladium implicatum]
MAPMLQDDALLADPCLQAGKKPNMYLLEDFPAEAVEYCQTLFDTVLPTDAKVHRWRENADAILVRELIISAKDIQSAKRLRAIGKQGTGIDIIDQDACAERDIPILNTPGVNAQSVAELVMTLTMAVKRQIRSISIKQAQGTEVRKEHCSGTMMTGKAIGILGMGAIGTAVARMFQGAFQCKVYAYDPFAPANAWADIPHHRVTDFNEMLPFVDMLTLHVPLNKQTRGLIGMAQLKAMKREAVLINVARGGIVVEDDLITALEQDEIAGAGLDCHDEEPPTLARYERLWKTEKVISTPHIGATTVETQVTTATAAMNNVFKYLTASKEGS